MLERNAAEVDVPDALSRSGDLHPREVVHALGDAVMRATGGKLRDDATVVCLDWYGGPPDSESVPVARASTTPQPETRLGCTWYLC
jgi:hypothetical protein